VAEGGEADTLRPSARLALGDAAPQRRALFEAALPRIDDCWDCADSPWVRSCGGGCASRYHLGDDLCARIDRTVAGYRYWMDEPGDDVQWYFSENHALLFHTAAHLGGHLLPDATFTRSGRKGSEQSAVGAKALARLARPLRGLGDGRVQLRPLLPHRPQGPDRPLRPLPDPDIRERAGRGIARLVEIVANSPIAAS
jgi:hypothetical protein